MSFLYSHPNFSQDNQTENLVKQPPVQPKESTMSYTHYQSNNIRVFGTELTNLVRVENENNQNEDPNIQISKLPHKFDQTKSLRNNAPKLKIRAPFMPVSSDVSMYSNTTFDYGFHDDSKLKESFLTSFDESEIKEAPMEACDIREKGNPQYVSDYAATIFKHLRENEKYIGKYGYMTKQTDINEKMRAILVDWIVDVHARFKLLDETLFLTINLIDRYLERCEIPRQKLQLVGITCMLIASKYEEIYAPEIKDFVYVTDKAYSREEILDMEGKILAALEFKLTTTTSYRFLERYANVHDADERTLMLAKYLIELSLIECRMLKYTPSNLAGSALYLACKILKRSAWDECLANTTQYSEQEIRPCAKDLCVLLQNAPKMSLQAIRTKFAHAKYMEISKIQLDRN
jgi:cyclin B